MPSSFASSAASPLETSPWRVLNAPLLVVEDSDEDFDTLVEAFHARYDHYLRLLGSVLHYWLESAAQDIPTAGVR